MADYFIQFSCIFDVGSAENAARADAIRSELAAELDHDEWSSLGFEMEVDREHGPGALWISSDEWGEPEHVIRFVLRCAEAFDLSGVWGFTWSLSCSRPLLDAFGGGAHVLDLGERKGLDSIDCSVGVNEQTGSASIAPDAAAKEGAAP